MAHILRCRQCAESVVKRVPFREKEVQSESVVGNRTEQKVQSENVVEDFYEKY